jgi:hypothetical protein
VNRAVGAYCWLYCLICSDPEGGSDCVSHTHVPDVEVYLSTKSVYKGPVDSMFQLQHVFCSALQGTKL